MKHCQFFFTTIALILFSQVSTAQDRVAPGDPNVSLMLEIERAIEKGVAWLESKQDKETGAWGDTNTPAFTAIATSAIMGNPKREEMPDSAKKAYDFLVSKQKADGGIYGKGLATYNTALSVTALSQSGRKEHLPVIAKARRLLINQQQDFDKRGETDNDFDGGIGYGGTYAHSDLSNSHLAMEALYHSKKVLADTEFDETADFDLDWDAAIEFVSRCQNTEETAKKMGDWMAIREEDKGGFIYFPGDTKSDEIEIKGEDGKTRTALRSYGSMGYAGMLAFIYADMDINDPRIQLALNWLQNNYTLEENPGMDAQGLFYYYHTMSKALSIARIKELKMPDGKSVDWKRQLALKVMAHQKPEGYWVNTESNRWMEDDQILVTAYALLTLEHIYHSL
ncbi:MAG: cycloartenol synthase [Verrucomicrobiales bacterium]|nr:cycloartenol synthase [Verrucomicrobiales bacterium]